MSDPNNPITPDDSGQDNIISLTGMYENYFLDYASYVILERAVPAIDDGLKPVQRRILHAMREMDDGRYHKVANVIGQTMQYHPHGDAAIGDALVNMGQKDLLIDWQGNWGNVLTGDGAAAPRYIEARLTKFALEVAFNRQTTNWQLSYDGRKNEPVHLPMKFPMLLAQGAEGIAVGLSTRILPHNFIELIKASIKILEDKKVKIYPDFPVGGMIDVSDYNDGARGGRVKVRCHIDQIDKTTLVIRDLPYGVTTTSLIDSIVKANEKGKIKIKKVIDKTAQDVEILIELVAGTSPDVTIGALYAFTNCEVSISPNACVIIDDKPHFGSVEQLLRASTRYTKELLRQELEIKKEELLAKWHMASLEKIFITNRIYPDIEECESFEEVISTIDTGLRQYVRTPSMPKPKGDNRLELMREITTDDITVLTEIRIKRISKYNAFKADEKIAELEKELEEVAFNLAHLTDFAVAYFRSLLDKYGKGKERKTVITTFDSIQATQVVANNAKLYANFQEGFIGTGLKKDTFITECSDIDDVIIFRKDGKFQVTRIADKVFVGKNLIHVAIWQKGDDRTTYNLVYVDGKTGVSRAKRFNVTAITRDREYDLTKGTKGSKLLYFSANANGEAETVDIKLSQGSSARKKLFDFNFAEIDIKGRGSQGNIITKYPIRSVKLGAVGKSTLGALDIWMDEVSGRLNTDERGLHLGAFDTGDMLLAIYQDGSYEQMELDLNKRFTPKDLAFLGKHIDNQVISAVYYEGERGLTLVKRFQIETTSVGQKFHFLTEHKDSKLYFASVANTPIVICKWREKNQTKEKEINLATFIDVKGWKSLGNKITESKLTSAKAVVAEIKNPKSSEKDTLRPGDSLELDF
ncbi:MAG: DNA gyrase/topoisomerase IV subunit A [Saprospiraceae bacterium]|nr:DNA gyrase/topoisomerase IV subunit A [Saprospiraceae bacterium]